MGRARLRRLIAITILLSAGVYLIGNAQVSLWDRDEPRYAQTSRQMLQSGDWVVPRLYDQVRTAKPIFIYWCQAGAMKGLGTTAFAARLPSAVAMTLTLALIAAGVWKLAGPQRSAWTVLVFATSAMTVIAAKSATTDSVLLLWITIAQGCLYLIWRGRGTWRVFAMMGCAIGLAGLTKGPVVLGVVGTTGMALLALRGIERFLSWRRKRIELPHGVEMVASSFEARGSGGIVIKVCLAVLIVIAIVGPWLYLVHQRAPEFLGTTLRHDVVERIRRPLESHGGPPGYHLAAIWGTLLPWSILLPLSIALAWKRRHIPQIRFALAAVLGPWMMFEIVSTKLPHYMLPVFPFLAFLIADAIVRCVRGQHKDLIGKPFKVIVTGYGLLPLLGAMALLILSLHFHDSPVPALLILLAAALYASVFVSRFLSNQIASGLIALGVGMMVIWILIWTVYLPAADPLRVSIRVAKVLNENRVTESVMLDYKEPSLAFYQNGTIREQRSNALSEELLDASPHWLVITRDVWESAQTTPSARNRLEIIAAVEGLAYADRMRRVEVMVVRKRD